MTVILIGIHFYAPNFIKIGNFLIDMRGVNDFKKAAVCNSGFLKFTVYVT